MKFIIRRRKIEKKIKGELNLKSLCLLFLYLGSMLFMAYLASGQTAGSDLPKISISEMYINTTPLTLSAKNNTFSVPIPASANYSAVEQDFSIENVTMHNYTMEFEDDDNFDGFIHAQPNNATTGFGFAIPFQVPIDCRATQISLYIQNHTNMDGIDAYIYASKFENNSIQINGNVIYSYYGVFNPAFEGWHSLNHSYFLNNSKTYNNTWFVFFYLDYAMDKQLIAFNYDNFLGDNNDEATVYNCSFEGTLSKTHIDAITKVNGSTIDLQAKVKLISGIDNSTVEPNYIHLKLNDTDVESNGNTSLPIVNDLDNNTSNLDYKISADWFNYSCVLTHRKIMFEKTPEYLNTEIKSYGVTIGHHIGFNILDTDFEWKFVEHNITAEVPSVWTISAVKHNGADQNYVIREYSDRKVVVVSGAIAGDWEIIADDPTNSSKLLLTKVGIYGGLIGGIAVVSIIGVVKYKKKQEEDLLKTFGD